MRIKETNKVPEQFTHKYDFEVNEAFSKMYVPAHMLKTLDLLHTGNRMQKLHSHRTIGWPSIQEE